MGGKELHARPLLSFFTLLNQIIAIPCPFATRVGVYVLALYTVLIASTPLNTVQAYYNDDGFVVLLTIYEPEWQLFVDVDNNRATGYEGYELIVRKADGDQSVRSATEFGYAPGGWGRTLFGASLSPYGASLTARVPYDTVTMRYALETYVEGEIVSRINEQYGSLLYGIIDFCPADRYKFQPGECGCGVVDRFGCGLFGDLDHDGDLDLRDFQYFQNGEEAPPPESPPEFARYP